MVHFIWYILIGLISGVIAKSMMHEHMTTFWTIVLGIIGSIIGGGVTHMFSRPTNEQYRPEGAMGNGPSSAARAPAARRDDHARTSAWRWGVRPVGRRGWRFGAARCPAARSGASRPSSVAATAAGGWATRSATKTL